MNLSETTPIEQELLNKIQEGKQKFNSPIGDKGSVIAGKFNRYSIPEPTENQDAKWIKFGKDNCYPMWLVDKFNKSATHNRIILTKAGLISGEGVELEDSNDIEQAARAKAFMKRNNFNSLVHKIAIDQQVFGYFTIGTTWSIDRKEIARLYHIDASTIRIGKPDGEDITQEITDYYYSSNWKKYTNKLHKPICISKFDEGNRIEPNGLIMTRKYRPNNRFYSLPDYIGGILSIQLEDELNSYQLNSIKNGLAPSLVISLNDGYPSIEQQQTLAESFQQLYGGAENAGRFILTFAKSKQNSPEIKPIETSNLHEIYKVLADWVQSQIIVAHGVTSPSLCGILTPGKLGGSAEIQQSAEFFQNSIIQKEQQEIENVLNEILSVNGFTLRCYIKDSTPLSFQLSDQAMFQCLTLDEIRKKLNYTPASEKDRMEIASRNAQSEIYAPKSSSVDGKSKPDHTKSEEKPKVAEKLK